MKDIFHCDSQICAQKILFWLKRFKQCAVKDETPIIARLGFESRYWKSVLSLATHLAMEMAYQYFERTQERCRMMSYIIVWRLTIVHIFYIDPRPEESGQYRCELKWSSSTNGGHSSQLTYTLNVIGNYNDINFQYYKILV